MKTYVCNVEGSEAQDEVLPLPRMDFTPPAPQHQPPSKARYDGKAEPATKTDDEPLPLPPSTLSKE